MAPLTKDSTEVANSSHETVAPRASAPPKTSGNTAGHLRADALSLEVPVKVHGSRLAEGASGSAPRTEPFEEETGTMIVFPQGGVLRMSTTVTAGQMLVVANLKTRQDAICRVIKVRTFTNMQGYVEVEFTHQQPGYWGVTFPSENAAAQLNQPQASPVISVPPPSIAPSSIAPPNIAPPSVAQPTPAAPAAFSPLSANPPAPMPPAIPVTPPIYVAPVPVAVMPSSKPEPPFISIGTQEKTQPAASLTAETPAKFVAPIRPLVPERSQPERSHSESVLDTIIPEFPNASVPSETHANAPIPFPPAAPMTPSHSLTMSELRGDTQGSAAVAEPILSHGITQEVHKQVAADLPETYAHSSFGSLSGGATLSGGHAAPAENFSATQDASARTAGEREHGPRQNNWILIAACVGVLFVAVIGGVFYLRPQFAGATNNSGANSNGPSAPQTLAFQTPGAIPEQGSPNGAAGRTSGAAVVVTPSSTAPAVTVHANTPAGNVASGALPNVAAKQPSKVTSQMMTDALGQHPVAPQRGDAGQSEAAPSLDTSAAGDSANAGALTGIVPSHDAVLASPEVQPVGPVKIGGNVKEPRVIARIVPEYPLLAKQSGIQGNVVIDTTIDAKGNVVNMRIVSGPNLLRNAALAALKRWKYEPSTLNGLPIAVQMQVTLKFSL